jgi:hypothetical protein
VVAGDEGDDEGRGVREGDTMIKWFIMYVTSPRMVLFQGRHSLVTDSEQAMPHDSFEDAADAARALVRHSGYVIAQVQIMSDRFGSPH